MTQLPVDSVHDYVSAAEQRIAGRFGRDPTVGDGESAARLSREQASEFQARLLDLIGEYFGPDAADWAEPVKYGFRWYLGPVDLAPDDDDRVDPARRATALTKPHPPQPSQPVSEAGSAQEGASWLPSTLSGVTHHHGHHDSAPHHGHHDHVSPHQERQRFDEAAATWDDPAKVSFADGVAAAIVATVPLEPTWVAMDFGAGTGLLGLRLADHVAEVDLVDTSAGMAAVARDRAAARTAAGRPGVTVAEVDLTAEPAPRERYDLVAASLSLHHVPDLTGIIAAFARLLAPGGWIAIAELAADPHGEFHSGVEHFSGHHGFEPTELERQLAAAGFTELSHQPCGSVRRESDGQARDFPVNLVTGVSSLRR